MSTHVYKLTDDQVAFLRSLPLHDDIQKALDKPLKFSGAVEHFGERQEIEHPELTIYSDTASEMSCVEDGVCEIDQQGPVAIVSKGEDAGAYVLAWVWVGDEDAGIEPADEDEDDED